MAPNIVDARPCDITCDTRKLVGGYSFLLDLSGTYWCLNTNCRPAGTWLATDSAAEADPPG